MIFQLNKGYSKFVYLNIQIEIKSKHIYKHIKKMSGNPGNSMQALMPTPPERGSFPLDHDGECTQQMMKYLECMKLVQNNNAPNCRLLAKEYLRCRMDHGLMEKDLQWKNLGLPADHNANGNTELPGATSEAHVTRG